MKVVKFNVENMTSTGKQALKLNKYQPYPVESIQNMFPNFSKLPPASLCLVLILLQLQFQFFWSHPCLPQESAALLNFKTLFSTDPKTADFYQTYDYYAHEHCGNNSHPRTESWEQGTDCCSSWDGVTCDGADGHVTALDLTCNWLHPNVPFTNTSSIMLGLHLLPRLRSLNLAFNNFSNSPMSPDILGFLPGLEYLNLTFSYLSWKPNPDFSSLSNLLVLDLSHARSLIFDTTGFKTLVSNLTKLEVLDLLGSDLSSVSFASPINFTHSLTSLSIDGCNMHGRLHEETFLNLPNLESLSMGYNFVLEGFFPKLNWSSSPVEILDLSSTNLSGMLPKSIGKLNKLKILYLRECQFFGSVPPLDNLTQLTKLDLSHNKLTGPIPPRIFSLPRLKEVSLRFNALTGHLHEFHCKALEILLLDGNKLQGSIPGSLFQLVNLTMVLLSSNNLDGTIEISMFSNLQNLEALDLSGNNVTVITKQVTSYAFQLRYLYLRSCNLSEFPEFIKKSFYLEIIDLSDNKLKGEVPGWMFEVGKHTLQSLNFSQNFLTSIKQIPWENLKTLDLHSNSLAGNIPMFPTHQLITFMFANNKLTGGLPYSICSSPGLLVLDFSNNSLSGTIPKCLPESNSLLVLDLGINKFHGTIPDTFPLGCHLQTVNLRNNELEGRVPQSLANCTELDVLDLGNNKLNDTFPSWLAPLSELEVLVLHYNQLHGYLLSSTSEIQFPKLRILDVSNNKFNGRVSSSFLEHFKGMTEYIKIEANMVKGQFYQDSVVLTLKGNQYEIERILTIFATLDFSSNNFQGQIPRLVGDFQALKVLNLSHNNLTGQIPDSLGNLTEMETLDLSWNQLVGKIPQQLTSVTSLEVLNLSQNRLVGSIPQGKQFNTFANDSYIGNLGLCGFPLSKECNTSEVPTAPHEEDLSFADDFTWQHVLIGFVGGFIVSIVASYAMFLIGKPQWFIGMVERESNRILRRRSRRHGRARN